MEWPSERPLNASSWMVMQSFMFKSRCISPVFQKRHILSPLVAIDFVARELTANNCDGYPRAV